MQRDLILNDGELNGMTLVRHESRNYRPISTPAFDGELMRDKRIRNLSEQTGTAIDEITGEEMPVMSQVPWKYTKWDDGLVAMTEAERAQRDEYDAAQHIGTISDDLWELASVFRTVLRRHFGDDAETNPAVTADAVESYFVGRNLANASGATDAEDAMILSKGFEAIADWTGDGTVWTFPWGMLP